MGMSLVDIKGKGARFMYIENGRRAFNEARENAEKINEKVGEGERGFKTDLTKRAWEMVKSELLSEYGEIEEDDFEEENEKVKVMDGEDFDAKWQRGLLTINEGVEAYRDELRDKGLEEGLEMDNLVMRERAKRLQELSDALQG